VTRTRELVKFVGKTVVLNSVLSGGTQDLKMGEMISMLAEQP
jgi:hypothetical protein